MPWLLLALLASVPVTASKAHALAESKSWEELYLAFSAADPKGYSAKDRAAIGADLDRGCAALSKDDAVMAYSLAERAAAFHPSASGLLCLAAVARATDQREAAEKALRQGLQGFPKEGAFGLELGRQLLEDKDAAGAKQALGRVPKRSAQYAEAQRLLSQAKAAEGSDVAARREVATMEARLEKGAPAAPQKGGHIVAAKGSETLTYESGVGPDGMRTRGNSRFLLKYFNNNRDFGQRADYEGSVVEALDEAYEFDKGMLGVAREAPCDVILYTREEFAAHFSAAAAYRVAGLYMMNAIRMNDAAEINPSTKATLVHEYVHAVVDDVVHGQSGRLPHWLNEGLAEYVEWRYQGSDGAPLGTAAAMRAAAKADQMPSLAQMDRGAPINDRNPAVSYGVSAVAVKFLLKDGGMTKLWGLAREVGGGAAFDAVLERRYGKTVAKLQEEVRDELAHL